MKFEQVEKLSAKELELLSLFSLGLERNEVGAKMGIKSNTIRVHLCHIYKKLNISSLHQAVVWYFVMNLNRKSIG